MHTFTCTGLFMGTVFTYLPVSLAVTPVADVGHRLCATLEHTKSVPHAIDHFSFIRAAVWPCVHAMVHGDILHKFSLGQSGQEDYRDSIPEGCWSVLHTLTLPLLFCGCGGCAHHVLIPVFPIPSPGSSIAQKSMQNKTPERFHLHQASRSKQVTW